MYDVGTLSLWIGVGVALIVGGIQAAGWRHRALIIGLIALGAISIVAALAVPPLADKWPAIARFMEAAATPSSWFMLFMLVAGYLLIVPSRRQTSDPSKPPHPTDWEINEDADDLRSELTRLVMNAVTSLRNEIDAVRNGATETVHRSQSKTDGISSEIQRLSAIVERNSRDLGQTLYLALLQTAEQVLSHLLSIKPKRSPDTDETSQLNEKDFKRNQDFIGEIVRSVTGTHRWSDVQNVLHNSEMEADRRLRVLPHDQWPSNLNPVDLRNCFIAALQTRMLCDYLEAQLREVRKSMRDMRHDLRERYADREKS